MLSRQPRTVVVAFPVWRMIRLFAAPQRFETKVFIPRIRMELSHPKPPIPTARNVPPQVGPAPLFLLSGLARHGICLRVAEHARRRRLASGADRIARRHADRTRRVCVRKSDSPLH